MISLQSFPNIQDSIDKYPNISNKKYAYGTAGFRDKGAELSTIVFRAGILAVLRAYMKREVIGVMITASHNPEYDNGVKIVDPNGGMLEHSWEEYAEKLANAKCNEVVTIINEIIRDHKIIIEGPTILHIGRDTRSSSEMLVKCCTDGMQLLGGHVINFGLLTTPQLHHSVRAINLTRHYSTLEGYNEETVKAVDRLLEGYPTNPRGPTYIDCANGVGGLSWKLLIGPLKQYIDIRLKNTGDGVLNLNCGSDYVQNNKQFPITFNDEQNDKQCISMDGDSDRVLCYYYNNTQKSFRLLDGDKISILFGKWLIHKLNIMNLLNDVSISIVQTAYANGSSTNYIKTNLENIIHRIAKTGVKNLHHIAIQYDIGIYFESNGHGTIVFSDKYKQILEDYIAENKEQSRACRDLKNAVKLINQAVGDAISDALLIQCVLTHLNITFQDWNDFYEPLYSYNSIVKVQDKSFIQNNDDETQVTHPIELQNDINKCILNYKNGRSFVRPSGTENAVRVYAEAATKEEAINLSKEVMELTYKYCNGVDELNFSLLK